MHSYSINGRNFLKIGGAILSISSSIALLLIIPIPIDHMILNFLHNKIINLSVVALISGILYHFFETKFWKINIIQKLTGRVPDLNGIWDITITPYNNINSKPVVGVMTIRQTYYDMSVIVEIKNSSRSWTTMSHINLESDNKIKLEYGYTCEPTITARAYSTHTPQTMHTHTGRGSVLFDSDLISGHGSYYTGDGRSGSGKITLKKR